MFLVHTLIRACNDWFPVGIQVITQLLLVNMGHESRCAIFLLLLRLESCVRSLYDHVTT